jgi:hypothetical protein
MVTGLELSGEMLSKLSEKDLKKAVPAVFYDGRFEARVCPVKTACRCEVSCETPGNYRTPITANFREGLAPPILYLNTWQGKVCRYGLETANSGYLKKH